MHKSNMKKSMKSEVLISACQIQATRMNKLEYHRLQRNINIMHDDLKDQLIRLQRQAQFLKHHYTNVVRVVKPNPTYQSWKQTQDEPKSWLEPIKAKCKTNQQVLSTDEILSEEGRPLLLLLDNDVEKVDEPKINFLQPKTLPVNKNRVNPLLNVLNEQSIKSHSTQSSESGFLPPIMQPSSRKFIPPLQTANTDTLYGIALQNQTAYKSVERTRIQERKLLDKEFASQHRALKGTIRSAGLVN